MNKLKYDDATAITMAPGVSRRVLSHTPGLMLVEVTFASSAVVPVHNHPHQQISYIKSGRFSFTSNGESEEAGPGDSLAFASDVEHGVTCLEDGVVIDCFTPAREDFL
ncbi:cupin domain-containing protein [uncultured Sphaerochaeta sp.]|uniref:cupin domain-containing protein n=1 Tax=uncultured Sphaerochaeta sp. TaxID=886478 RepID=UPI0029CA4A69|nr:cupin domain-containing protein [uncultured Sphaerochaeta sp.]